MCKMWVGNNNMNREKFELFVLLTRLFSRAELTSFL